MMKKITAGLIAAILLLTCCAFTVAPSDGNGGLTAHAAETANIETLSTQVEETTEVTPLVVVPVEDDIWFVEKIDEFVDENLENYTIEELDTMIADLKNRQINAHKLAEEARALGWPEDCQTITSAKNEWWNSQKAIKVYEAQRELVYNSSMEARFADKMAEYPAATEIWLYMKDLDWNDYVCAGIMGNLMAEVGGQTLDIQYWLYGSGYYGMCQWNRVYCEGVWGADLQGQCDFLRDTIKYEIDTFGYAYQRGFNLDSFLALENERDAALAFAKTYERCSSASYWVRQENATKAYEYFVD